MEFLFAPTVPSEPSPQNLQAVVPSGAVSGLSVISSERFVTSSVIPIVNLGFSVFLNTAIICSGVVSFEPRPYLPENTGTSLNFEPLIAATTSRKSGSPSEPGSFVLSRTEILLTESGIASTSLSATKGL